MLTARHGVVISVLLFALMAVVVLQRWIQSSGEPGPPATMSIDTVGWQLAASAVAPVGFLVPPNFINSPSLIVSPVTDSWSVRRSPFRAFETRVVSRPGDVRVTLSPLALPAWKKSHREWRENLAGREAKLATYRVRGHFHIGTAKWPLGDGQWFEMYLVGHDTLTYGTLLAIARSVRIAEVEDWGPWCTRLVAECLRGQALPPGTD